MLKPSDNPPMLPTGAERPGDLTGPWWVAHTKARHEKTFAWDLRQAGIGYFLPLMQRVTVSGGRKRQVMKPLFTSYVFFTGDEQARYHAMTTHRLCTVLPVGEPALLSHELDQVHQAVQGEAAIDAYPDLAAGRMARVKAGPFEGMEGRIVEWRGATRLMLQVSMLGQGAALEIEPDLLESLDDDTTPAAPGGL